MIESWGSALNDPKIDKDKIAKIPFLSLLGDNISPETSRQYTDDLANKGDDAITVALPEIGITGNGHAMMVERNNEEIAQVIADWIGQHVK